MRKPALNKIRNAVGNGVWQLVPSLANLLLSLLIVRLYSASVWGTIVSVLVVQQIVSSVLSWGNKDYLQREIAANSLQFNLNFSAFFKERLLLFVLAGGGAYFFDIVPKLYFAAFLLLVFGRFLQQSFDILIIRNRKFSLAVALEIAMLVLQIVGIFALYRLKIESIQTLLMIFWVPMLLKGLVLLACFRKHFNFARTQIFLLKSSFSFAMLSLSGLVHSKIDLLLVSAALDHETLGKYQIITAFLWNIQSVALYVSSPYIHNFYRLNAASQGNYSRLLKRLGLGVVPVGVCVMALLLRFAFKIDVTISMLCASLLFGAASFIYLPWIFQLNNQKQEHRVLLINIFGIAVLAALLLAVNHFWGLSLETTLWIVTFHQALLTMITFVVNKKPLYA